MSFRVIERPTFERPRRGLTTAAVLAAQNKKFVDTLNKCALAWASLDLPPPEKFGTGQCMTVYRLDADFDFTKLYANGLIRENVFRGNLAETIAAQFGVFLNSRGLHGWDTCWKLRRDALGGYVYKLAVRLPCNQEGCPQPAQGVCPEAAAAQALPPKPDTDLICI